MLTALAEWLSEDPARRWVINIGKIPDSSKFTATLWEERRPSVNGIADTIELAIAEALQQMKGVR